MRWEKDIQNSSALSPFSKVKFEDSHLLKTFMESVVHVLFFSSVVLFVSEEIAESEKFLEFQGPGR